MTRKKREKRRNKKVQTGATFKEKRRKGDKKWQTDFYTSTPCLRNKEGTRQTEPLNPCSEDVDRDFDQGTQHRDQNPQHINSLAPETKRYEQFEHPDTGPSNSCSEDVDRLTSSRPQSKTRTTKTRDLKAGNKDKDERETKAILRARRTE